mgnify:CR=1 FL=1
MINILKKWNTCGKVFLAIVVLMNNITMASDDQWNFHQQRSQQNGSAITWGALGVFAGTMLGYRLAHQKEQSPDTFSVEFIDYDRYSQYTAIPDLNPQRYDYYSDSKIWEVQYQLDALAKYGKYFDLRNHESAIMENIAQLGLYTSDIDGSFYTKLGADYKKLQDIRYAIWLYNLSSLQEQQNTYCSNFEALMTYFKRHANFIAGYQIVNYYVQVPCSYYQMLAWIKSQTQKHLLYPLVQYAELVEIDLRTTEKLLRDYRYAYPILYNQLVGIYYSIQSLLDCIYTSDQYRQEMYLRQQHDRYVLQEQTHQDFWNR